MSASSTSEYSVETIVDLLSGAESADWTNAGTPPDRIGPVWDYDHNDRTAFPDPALYVWQPIDSDISKFSIDGDHTNETNTIEVLIMTLEPLLSKEYQRDVIQILSQYYNDNEANTTFYEIAPQNKSDLRNEAISGTTDHYLAWVQIETNQFNPTGV